jgi:hypothetical protein
MPGEATALALDHARDLLSQDPSCFCSTWRLNVDTIGTSTTDQLDIEELPGPTPALRQWCGTPVADTGSEPLPEQ